ncbi:MAG: hypothetical protein DMG70_03045 [Acidobacteria bacterium]|nr:MAG: hypothetical protein DMG70_03045 [Acidobacteriota bacterium]PYY12637.1 MAG: hypothetical protein DMG69_00580 [Acidobacteriota bacterium]
MQLYRSGIAHHERGKRLCPGLQRAGRGRAQLPVDRRPAGDARRQRQTTDAASGRGDPRAIRTEAGGSGQSSVGVARQYCGQVGKEENCQVAVSLSISGRQACRSPGD